MSTLNVATVRSLNTLPPAVQNSSGTEIGTFCRAWVNFNGTGTVAIRASFNVSSITDNGTGDYTVNFTTSMPDANYSFSGTVQQTALDGVARGLVAPWTSAPTTTALRVAAGNTGLGTLFDAAYVNVAIFR